MEISLALLEEITTVIKALRPAWDTTVEYPAIVATGLADRRYWFGTANETWDGNPEDGSNGCAMTDVPVTSADAALIAAAIVAAYDQAIS